MIGGKWVWRNKNERVKPGEGEELEKSRRKVQADLMQDADEEMCRQFEQMVREREAEIRNRAAPRSETPPVRELPGQGRCVGYVIAKRSWSIDLVGGVLKSQYDTTWLPGEPVRAEQPNHPTTAGFGAGIYGMKLEQPPQEFPTFSGRSYDMIAYGLVALWGRIKEHAKGYRAEWAYPLEIKRLNFDGPFHDVLLDALNERYGCRPHKEEASCQLVSTGHSLLQWQQAALQALGPNPLNQNPFKSGGP